MPRTIRFDRRSEELHFESASRRYRDVDGYVFHESELAQFKAVDLKHALQRAANLYEADEMDAFIVEGEVDEFDDEWSPPGPVQITIKKGMLLVQIHIVTRAEECDEETLPEVYRLILAPYLARRKAKLRDIEMTVEYHTVPYVWRIDIECDLRNRLARDLFEVGSDAIVCWKLSKAVNSPARQLLNCFARAGRTRLSVNQKAHGLTSKVPITTSTRNTESLQLRRR